MLLTRERYSVCPCQKEKNVNLEYLILLIVRNTILKCLIKLKDESVKKLRSITAVYLICSKELLRFLPVRS